MIRAFAGALLAFSSVGSAGLITWTDWTSATTGNAGSASGTLGAATVTYTGQVFTATQTAGGTNFWLPNNPFLFGGVANEPPCCDIITMSTGGTRTITFSSGILNPIIAFVSVNQPVTAVAFSGTQAGGTGVATQLTVGSNGGHFGTGSATVIGNVLTPTGDYHGVVQLNGLYTSITLNVTGDETWSGFTIGYDTVPEPSTFALLGLGLAGFAMVRRRR